MERLVLSALVGFGLIARLWILAGPMGALDSDEAVIGLMARHLLHGQFSIFFWGQHYGGSQEAIAAAAVFAIFRPSVYALKAVPITFSAVAAALTWRIGRSAFGARAGRFAGALFWVWPAAFVWWSTKTGPYWASLSLGLVVLLLLCRLDRRAREGIQMSSGRELTEIALLGFATGLAWWANPQTLYIMVPAYLWFCPQLLRRWRHLPVIGLTAVVGAAPWIRYNLVHHWVSFTFPPQPALAGGYLSRLRAFFQVALPMALGLRIPYTRAWVLGSIGIGAFVLLLALFVGWVIRCASTGRSSRVPLLFAFLAAVYPFLFAISPFSWYVAHPRYLLFLAPTLAVLLGYTLSLHRTWILGMAAAVALSVVGLAVMNSSHLTQPGGPDVLVPTNLAPLRQMLTRYDVHDAFADYWLAYRTTFETREHVLVSPVYVVRDPALDQQVRQSARPAYIFISASSTLPVFEAACSRLHVSLVVHKNGPFTLVLPQRKVLPEQVGPIWQP